MDRSKIFALLLSIGLGIGVVVLGLTSWLFPTTEPISEISVKVTGIEESGAGEWIVPRDTVAMESGQ